MKRGSSVVRHLPMVLEVPGSIPPRGENFGVQHAFSSVICRDDTRQVHHPEDWDVNWMSPVQGESPPVQVKSAFILQPGVYKVHLSIILARGSGSI